MITDGKEKRDAMHDRRAELRKLTNAQLRKILYTESSPDEDKRLAQIYLAARTPKKRNTLEHDDPHVMVNFRISQSLKDEMGKAARMCRVTLSEFIRIALENEIREIFNESA